MALNRVDLGIQYFPQFAADRAIANAQIYIGLPDLDPSVVSNQIQAFVVRENGSEVAVPQPIRTGAGGVPTYLGSPVQIAVDVSQYSVKIVSSTGAQIYYQPNNLSGSFINAAQVRYDPLAGDETDVQSRLRQHDSEILDIENVLNFSSLDDASTPVLDTDLLLIRQSDGNKKIESSVFRVEFATEANAAADRAEVAEQNAETAQFAAEAARDAAQLFAGVYVDTAAGLAATVSGDYFSVPRPAPNEVFLDLYRNNAGVADFINSYASSYLFDLTYTALSGWAYVLVDQNDNIAFGVKLDGSVTIGNMDDVESKLELIVNSDLSYERSGFVYALVDSDNRIAFGVSPDGDFLFQGEWLSGVLGTSVQPQIDALDIRVDDIETQLTTGPNIVCWGDSLTAGAGTIPGGSEAYPARLAALLGRTATNLGIGGQNSTQIIARQGGKCALATITGNTIPASGGVVVTFAATVPIAVGGSINGSLAGIPGTLSLSSGVYTFTRTDAGVATKSYPLTPFVPDVAIYENRIAIFWLGRNNGWNTTDSAAINNVISTVFSDVESGIRRLTQLEKRFIILGVTAVDTPNEYVGTVSFNGKRTLAGMYAEKYPQQFIDIDRILNDSGTGTGQDAIDRDNGVIPTSLRSDPTHLNAAGYLLVAEIIRDRILLNGW